MRTLTLFNNLSRSPLRLFDSEAFDRDFFDSTFPSLSSDSEGASYSSLMKFNSEKSNWDLTVELAGVSKDSLKIDAKEGHLILTGEKTRGLNLGKLEQTLKLPQGIDYDKIEAVFEDGVLSLTLPLAEKKSIKTIQFNKT